MVGEERNERRERVSRRVVFRVEETGEGVVAEKVDLLGVGVVVAGGDDGGFGVEVRERRDGHVDGDWTGPL